MNLVSVVAPASNDEIAEFYRSVGDYTVMRIDGKLIGMGTIGQAEGRTWVMLTVCEGAGPHVIRIVRALKARLRDRNETVYALCGGHPHFPKSERLLSLCGFVPTSELMADGKRVWQWNKRDEAA